MALAEPVEQCRAELLRQDIVTLYGLLAAECSGGATPPASGYTPRALVVARDMVTPCPRATAALEGSVEMLGRVRFVGEDFPPFSRRTWREGGIAAVTRGHGRSGF